MVSEEWKEGSGGFLFFFFVGFLRSAGGKRKRERECVCVCACACNVLRE